MNFFYNHVLRKSLLPGSPFSGVPKPCVNPPHFGKPDWGKVKSLKVFGIGGVKHQFTWNQGIILAPRF